MKPRKPLPATTITTAAIHAAKISGCNCNPDVELTEEIPGVFHATVRHDNWCPLLQRRSANWS